LLRIGGDELVKLHQVGVVDARERPKLLLELVEGGRRESQERLERDRSDACVK